MTIRVLVVEDNRADARLLAEILAEVPGRPFALTTAETLADALEIVHECEVVLLDLSLPDALGRETVERMVAGARAKPIVVLTGTDDDETATVALHSGAQDYLVKGDITASSVARSIRYAIERKRAECAELARAKSDEAAARSQFLANTLREVTRGLDLQGALSGLARSAIPRLGDLCIVDLLQEAGHAIGVAHAGAELRAEDVVPNEEGGPVATVIREHAAVRLTAADPGLDCRFRSLADRLGATSFLIVPLVARDRVIGTMTLASCELEHAYSGDEQLLAEELAAHAALAVDNARLHDQTRRAVRGRDELLSIVSHDLRNPLNVMALALHVLESGREADRSTGIGRIRRAVDRMQRLIGDLLDVARVDAGTLEVQPRPVVVATVLDDALDLLQPLALERGIRLVRDYPHVAALGSARLDPERIAQVLSNLVGNALKFTPRGGVVRVGARAWRDGTLRIEVRDSGPGIDPDHLPHLFDRFWQRERRSDGVGLGLAIAKGIVEAHGGTIHVESSPGMGALFWFAVESCSELHPSEPTLTA